MGKKTIIATLLTALVLVSGGLGYLLYEQSFEKQELQNTLNELIAKNSDFEKSIKEKEGQFITGQKERSQLSFQAVQTIRAIDGFQNLLLNDAFGATQPIIPVRDELNNQKNALYLFIEDNNSRDLDTNTIEKVQKRVYDINDFLKVAIALKTETSTLLPPDTNAPGGEIKNGLDPATQKIRSYRWVMYTTVLAPVLEKLKEETGSQKLMYCQNLTQDAKDFRESVDTVTKNMDVLNKALSDKMWLTPIGRLIIKDSYEANLKAFSAPISQSLIAKATTSDYTIGVPCNFFSNQSEGNAKINANLVASINDVQSIDLKVSETLKPYCKSVTEDICKAAVSELATTVAIQSSTYPFTQVRLENRIETALVNFIKAKENQKREQTLSVPIMDRKDINSAPQKY